MKDRVEGILPALIGEPLLGGALIFDEAVTVGIARTIDPAQPGLDRRPQLGQRFLVAGALDIEAGEQHEQRRRIDAAVILRERHLAQRGHFAAAHLMQDLSGLRVGERIDALGLIEGQPLEHAARDPRIDPQHLQRGDQSVAAERRRVPGNAGIGISPLRRIGHQHVEVGHRLAQHLVENVVRGFDAGGTRRSTAASRGDAPAIRGRTAPASRRPACCRTPRQTANWSAAAPDRNDRSRYSRQPRRPRIEMQRRAARLVVEPLIIEPHIGRPEQFAGADAAARALFTTHFEQIGKIIVELQRQVEARGTLAVVLQCRCADRRCRARGRCVRTICSMSFCSTMRPLR